MNKIDEKKKENCCGRELDDHAHRHNEREEDEGSPAGRIVRLAAGAILLLGGIAAEKLSFGGWMPLALFVAAYLLTGCDVLFRAVQNLFHGRIFDENFLMTVSTAGALAIGAAEEAAAVMLFYQIGEFLSDLAVDRARDAVSALLDLRPAEANVVRNGVSVTVSPGEVAVGETILLRPGERIPLDGVVLTGESRIDASGVTGESVPRSVKEGGEVLSGCVNGEGLLTVRVTRAESESAAAKILELTEQAAERKAPAERFITKFSRIYTPIVCGIALLVAAVPPLLLHGGWSKWIYRGLTALVISCPCALVISIPLTFFSGIGAASKAGVLLKGSNTLEALAKADVFVFDKTGTVTKGDFEVTKMIPASSGGVSPEEVLSAAACAEAHSSHPIAQSILRAYGKTPETADSCIEHSGCGVEAVVGGSTILCGREGWLRERGIETEPCTDAGTKVWAARDGRLLGSLVIADEIKPGSRAAMESLKKRGAKRIVMLTGDNRETAEAVAAEVGIPEVEASLLPEGKAERLGAILAEKHGGIVFVGDGINDAPVLTAADVGVAMGGLGSDAAMEAADAILMTDELPALAKAMDIARKTVRIGKENIIFAVAVKALCIMLGAAGAVGMGIAVFGDVGVMLLCVANAMRKKA